jgi:hypothetical protein
LAGHHHTLVSKSGIAPRSSAQTAKRAATGRAADVYLAERLQRRAQAERIAKRWKVDAGDVEHVLFNLTLDPWQRLLKSFKRGGLRRLSTD